MGLTEQAHVNNGGWLIVAVILVVETTNKSVSSLNLS
jgi:hypothetical protein